MFDREKKLRFQSPKDKIGKHPPPFPSQICSKSDQFWMISQNNRPVVLHDSLFFYCCALVVLLYSIFMHLSAVTLLITPPTWPSSKGTCLRSGRSRVWIPLAQNFSESSHTNDFKIGTPLATLPGAWRYRVSAGTGRPSVSILWLGEAESLISNLYLRVAARTFVWADPSLRYTSLLLGR